MSGINRFEHDIFSKIEISKQQKMAFYSAIVSGLVAHMYQMTNLLLNNDSVMSYYKAPDPYSREFLMRSIGSDRWLLSLSEMLIGWFKTPIVAGTMILLMCAIFSMIFVELYGIKTIIGSISCAAIITTYPTIAAYMTLYSVGYMLSSLLVIAGLYLFYIKKQYFWTIILWYISLAIFPVSIMGILVGYIYILIKDCLYFEKIDKDYTYAHLLKFVGIVLLECVILLLSFKLNIRFNGGVISTYQGEDALASSSFLIKLFKNIPAALAKTRLIRLSSMQQLPKLKFTLRICYIIQLLGSIYLFFKEKIYKDKAASVVLLICMGGLPLALSAFTIISESFAYSGQHRMQWVYVFCGMWIITELLLDKLLDGSTEFVNGICRKVFMVILVNTILMIYGFILFDNILYYSDQYILQKDSSLMTRVLAQLDSMQEFDYNINPVYFCGLPTEATPDTTMSPLILEPDLYNIIISDTESNLWCYGDASYKSHIYKLEGVVFKDPDNEFYKDFETGYEAYREIIVSLTKSGEFKIVNYKNSGTYVIFIRTDRSYSYRTR
ncbi:MAG: glucosyltransferase domain-containing protein [Lachnospiraceae bacterium]|nr:glucosyltransferase domain-containing protein [Lachnospiraceae bacterium]